MSQSYRKVVIIFFCPKLCYYNYRVSKIITFLAIVDVNLTVWAGVT